MVLNSSLKLHSASLCLHLQARVKDQETQKKLFNIKRFVCIGGGVALVLVAWALLIASSRNRSDPGTLAKSWHLVQLSCTAVYTLMFWV